MALLESYLVFNGNCAEAMRFYERTLSGKSEMFMTYADSPAAERAPPGNESRVMHCRLAIEGGQALMACDTHAGQPHEGMHGFSLSLGYSTAAEAKRVFDALAEGGRITMPQQPTFWVQAFGTLTDRFGTHWMVGGGPKSF